MNIPLSPIRDRQAPSSGYIWAENVYSKGAKTQCAHAYLTSIHIYGMVGPRNL